MSIHLPVIQGSHGWRMARMGLPTASEYKKILTPKTLKVSKPGIATLAAELVAERAMMQPLEIDLAGFAERGSILENSAVPYYEMERDVDVSRDGFYFDPELVCGASPDGVTPDAGLEIKSLSPSKHLKYMMGEPPAEYLAQVQSCMWIVGRDKWDLLFYHPTLPSKILTIARDDKYIEMLKTAITGVNAAIDAMMTTLEGQGVDFTKWQEHVERLGRGEAPEEQRQQSVTSSIWGSVRSVPVAAPDSGVMGYTGDQLPF